MIEQCDVFGGIVVSAESFGFWGGFSSGILQVAVEDFAPRNIDTFGLFNSLQATPLSIADVALNLNRLESCSTRSFPLLLAEKATPLNNRLLADMACMVETHVTPTVFPASGISIPPRMSHLAFGTGQATAGSENIALKSMCTMSPYSGGASHAKCIIDRSLESLAPVYLADPELGLLG